MYLKIEMLVKIFKILIIKGYFFCFFKNNVLYENFCIENVFKKIIVVLKV